MFGKKEECPKISIVFNEVTNNYFSDSPHRVHLVLNLNTQNKSILQIMALSLAANQKVLGTPGLVDQVTNLPVTGSFAGTVAASDNPAAFTASVNAGGDIEVVGVAAGAGNVGVTTNATYTDSLGASQTKSLSVTVAVTITAVVTADQVNLVVTFGTPTAQ